MNMRNKFWYNFVSVLVTTSSYKTSVRTYRLTRDLKSILDPKISTKTHRIVYDSIWSFIERKVFLHTCCSTFEKIVFFSDQPAHYSAYHLTINMGFRRRAKQALLRKTNINVQFFKWSCHISFSNVLKEYRDK